MKHNISLMKLISVPRSIFTFTLYNRFADIFFIASFLLLSSAFSLSARGAEIEDTSSEFFIEGVSLQKKTIIDINGLRITAERLTGTWEDDSSHVSVIFQVENHSPETVNIMADSSCFVNNLQTSAGYLMLDIPKGETTSLALINLTPSFLSLNGIQYIETIDTTFYIRFGKRGSSTYQQLRIPFTLDTTSERTGKAVIPFESSCLYDNNGIRIWAAKEELIMKRSGKVFLLRMENNSPYFLIATAPLTLMDNGLSKPVTCSNVPCELSVPSGKSAMLLYYPQFGFRTGDPRIYQFELDIQASLYNTSLEAPPFMTIGLGPLNFQY